MIRGHANFLLILALVTSVTFWVSRDQTASAQISSADSADATAPVFHDLSTLPGVSGQLIMKPTFASEHVRDRPLYIWLPPSYGQVAKRYPVIYMLDGEHMFIDNLARPSRTEWQVDETLTRLLDEGRIREPIVVAIPSGGSRRYDEYVPQAPMQKHALRLALTFLSDEHMRFLTEEVKPFIDTHFPTLSGPDDTYLLGASVSGLTVMEAMTRYPDLFGAVAAMSPHLSLADGDVVTWLTRQLQTPDTHRLYIDRGTKGLEAQYARGFRRLRLKALDLGYVEGESFEATVYKGAAHKAKDFRDRIHAPLLFLLATDNAATADDPM